ncbi:branched-chain amino acid ABC transporter ATP-binding protein/permease [Nocardioides carbamazepini]|uniref:branched-chain amino acid ABC transporter ATP-binding protein/permease n=1 Tax=Nocardioides carbamazepini TaxID=2854259 RepID=UPI00214A1E6F|nr:branched-chain amino acid ABC transporter ATP-binding protein/permease [Nocardioides carbamazepini]MCR1786663.1 branched-chain amino acid ABC transporter ATP-binding protein/permease [Nocardioides carbamazepini]
MAAVALPLARLRPWAFPLAVAVVALLAILYTTDGSGVRLSNSQQIGQICAFLVASVGLNLLVGRTGMHSFAQGAFLAIGAYTFVWTQLTWDAPFLVGMLLAALVPALAGVVIAVATTRMRGPQLAMVTLITAVVVYKVLAEWKPFGQFGGYPNTAAHGSSLIEPPSLFGWELQPPLFGGTPATALVPVIVIAALSLLLYRRVAGTGWGLSLSVIKQSELLAAHLGVNVYLRKVAVVSFAAGLAGLGGACYALVFAHLQPESFALMLGVNLIVMVILGGAGTVLGPVIGTAVIVYLQTAPSVAAFVRWENDTISDRWYLSAQGLIAFMMIAVLFAMPAGIVGSAQRLLRRRRPRRAAIAPWHGGEPAAHLVAVAHTSGESAELVVTDVGLAFGGVRAVDGVSITVAPGSIVAVIGPNGAGKSSVVNLISGVYAGQGGSMHLGGTPLRGLPAYRRARLGIARTFQTPILSPELTVVDNVLVGSEQTASMSCAGAVSATRAARRARERDLRDVAAALELVGLTEEAGRTADELSYGQQRLVELARALVSRPRLLVLDEPAAGLNPTEIAALALILERLRDQGLSVLLVEHHMDLVRRIADHVVCMIDGRVAAAADAHTVLSDPLVVSAYLGQGHVAVAGGQHA